MDNDDDDMETSSATSLGFHVSDELDYVGEKTPAGGGMHPPNPVN